MTKYRVDEHVTMIVSVADVGRLQDNPCVIVARVDDRRNLPDEVWVTWKGGPAQYGPVSVLEIIPGWIGE